MRPDRIPAALAICLGVAAPAAAAVVLNEVLYDPEGSDAGGEYVELYNPAVSPASLAGARLEFANGAEGEVWQVRWAGTAADGVPAGGWFLIADDGWSGPPADAVVALGLQNGPDAVRLVRPDGTVDLLGYGDLEVPGLYETRPCPEPPSGLPLARRPDGADSDDNAADWVVPPAPTPGGPNWRRHALALESRILSPPSLAVVGGEVTASLKVRNEGLADLPACPALLTSDGGEAARAWAPALAPGEARVLSWSWRPATAGRRELGVRLVAAADGADLDLAVGAYQVGPSVLQLNEVMAAPPGNGCEWVELANVSDAPVTLDGHRLRDADGDWRELAPREVPPHGLVLLVQDEERFRRWWQDLLGQGASPACGAGAPPLCELPSSWPALNNSPPADRDYADRLELGDADGCTLDHLVLGGPGSEVPAGRSLERVAALPAGDPTRNWGPSTDPVGGTPGCANSLSSGGGFGRLELAPNPFRPGGREGVLHLRFRLPDGAAAWDAQVYDLWGRQVRDLGGDDLGAGPRDVLWDGSEDGGGRVPPGGYVVLLRTYGASGLLLASTRRLAVVAAGDR